MLSRSCIIGVTGSTGFIGRHVVDVLLQRGAHVRLLVRDRARCPFAGRDGVEIIDGDLFDSASLASFCAGISCVVHLAGCVSALRGADFDRVNVAGVSILVDAANAAGVGRFILMSSYAAAYPHRSVYGMSKHRGEVCLRERARADMAWFILRPCAVYGAGDVMTAPLISQLSSLIGLIPSRRKNRFSLIHVSDLARAVADLVYTGTFPDRSVHAIHDGKADGYSWDDLVRIGGCHAVFIPRFLMYCAAFVLLPWYFFRRVPPVLSFSKVRDLYLYDWVCPDNPLEDFLGWRAEIDMDSGLRSVLTQKPDSVMREGGVL